MLGPIRVWDVLTNPKNIGSGTSPIATFNNEYAEYSAFSDDYLFIGHARQEISNVPGCSKITFSDPKSMKVVNRIYGRLDTTYNDDQFVLPFGNLVALTDDQSPYRGWVIAVHQTAPDTTAARRGHGHPRQRLDGRLDEVARSASRSRTTSSSRR